MISKNRLLKKWRIYAILDDSLAGNSRELLKRFFCLAESPVDAIQFRFKDPANISAQKTIREMISFAKKKDLPVIMNDRPDLALLVKADGVHLGKSDLSPEIARRMLGEKAIIGCTIRGPEDISPAMKKYADYLSVGPVFRTPLKPDLKSVSAGKLRELCERTELPLVAIGGINEDNVQGVAVLGIRTVAFVRYGMSGGDTKRRIRRLREKMEMVMP